MAEQSRWQDIYKCLQNDGFDVYAPGVKTGECTSPYVVVKNDGSTKHASFSTDVDLYAVMVFVPKQKYSELEVQVQRVKESMKKLSPMVMPYGQQAPSYYDETFKAHMVSIEYKNYKKL